MRQLPSLFFQQESTGRRPKRVGFRGTLGAGLMLASVCSAGCAGPSDPPAASNQLVLTPPAELLLQPAQIDPPSLMTLASGERVTATTWDDRQQELLTLLGYYVYGEHTPEVSQLGPVLQTSLVPSEEYENSEVLTIEVGGDNPFRLVLIRPTNASNVPVFLGLNKCGNQTLTQDVAFERSPGFAEVDCEGRGSRASFWDLQQVLAQGMAVATVHQSDFGDDDVSFATRAGPDGDVALIATWAQGLILSAQLLNQTQGMEDSPILAFGHSRRGKAALWAAANSPAIAGVWSHQSGTGGSTMSRSANGESIAALVALFPHWFPPNYEAFAGAETFLPLDQHFLLAAIAPKPLLVTDGDTDFWADPPGTDWSVQLANEAYTLLGAPPIARAIRTGGHSVRSDDWTTAIAWANELP